MNADHVALQRRIQANFDAQGLVATLGARLVLINDGEVHIELTYAKVLSQQHGYLHARAISSIPNSACDYALLTKTLLGSEVVMAKFKINLKRPAFRKQFVANGYCGERRQVAHDLQW